MSPADHVAPQDWQDVTDRIKSLEDQLETALKPNLNQLPLGNLMRYTAANLELDANALVGSVATSGSNIVDHSITDVKHVLASITKASIANDTLTYGQLDPLAEVHLYGVSGYSSGPTNAGGPTGLTDMSISANTLGKPVLGVFSGQFSHNTAGGSILLEWNDNVLIRQSAGATFSVANEAKIISLIAAFTPAAGTRSHSIQWTSVGGTATATASRRTMALLEIPT